MNSNQKEIIGGASGYFLTSLLNAGLSFIFVIMATRILGVGGYGLIALGITVFALSNNFGLLGFDFFSQKKLSGIFDREKSEKFGSMIILNILVALSLFTVLFFGSEFIANSIFNKAEFVVILKIISLAILFSLPTNLFRSVLRSQRKIKQNFLSICLEGLLKFLFLALIPFFENNLMGVAMVILLSSFGSFIFTFSALLKEKLLPAFHNIKFNVKKTFLLSSQFLAVGLGYFLASQTDRLMLGRMTSSEELGFYAIAASMAFIVIELHGSIISIFMPIISKLYMAEKEKIEETYFFSNILSGLASLCMLIFFLATGIFILDIFFGIKNFQAAYFILIILSTGAFINSLTGPTGALLNMTGRHKVELANTIFLVLLNIVLNYFMIKKYGALGAAIAILLSTIALNLVQIIEIRYFYKFFVLKKIHLGLFAVAITLIGSYLFFSGFTKNIYFDSGFLVIAETFVFLSAYYFLNKNQKNYIKSLVIQVVNNFKNT